MKYHCKPRTSAEERAEAAWGLLAEFMAVLWVVITILAIAYAWPLL